MIDPDLLARVVPATSMPVLAHERVLPVDDVLAPLFGEAGSGTSAAGLVRGHTVVCAGSAAVSCALSLVAGVTRAGSWAAVVAMPSMGLQAAATIGVALERTVFVHRPDANLPGGVGAADVGAVVSTLIDGMDLVVIAQTLASTLPAASMRRLQSRAQSKGSVVVIVGDSPRISADVRLVARTVFWEGLEDGHGHLRRRLVSLEMDGRRCPRPRMHRLWLPDATGAPADADADAGADVTVSPPVSISADRTGVVVSLHRTR